MASAVASPTCTKSYKLSFIRYPGKTKTNNNPEFSRPRISFEVSLKYTAFCPGLPFQSFAGGFLKIAAAGMFRTNQSPARNIHYSNTAPCRCPLLFLYNKYYVKYPACHRTRIANATAV